MRIATDPHPLQKQRFGWYMYDWANSAFSVTILAALFGPYLDKVVVPAGGYVLPLIGTTPLSATSLYGYALGISAFAVLLSSPVLGAIADAGSSRKRFMAVFAILGSTASALFFFVGQGDVALALGLFLVANFSFVSGNVFYDSFLPHLAGPDEQDAVSARGYAYGYAGGGLLFILHLLLVQFHDAVGISDVTMALRISLGSVGLWWAGFSLVTFHHLREDHNDGVRQSWSALAKAGFARVARTAGIVGKMRQLVLFLLAFMVYNDGIQTVIAMATVYGSDELHFDTLTLMGCLLMVQLVGVAGSQMFARISKRTGTKNAILLSLLIWTAVVVYAYFMSQPFEFWILGGVVGLVLGGSQALSRSLYSSIIPVEAAAEFFGFFSVFEKFSAIWGPIVFAVVRQTTGSSRDSIISLVVFFLVGGIALLFLNLKSARAESAVLADKIAGV